MAIRARVSYLLADGTAGEMEYQLTEAEIATGRLAPLPADVDRIVALVLDRVEDDPAPR